MISTILTLFIGLVLLALVALAGLQIWSKMVARKVETAIPRIGEIATVTGGKIHFLDQGEGQTIVMIHGLAGHLQNFTYATTDALKNDFRVIALDRPGSGYSQRDSDELARIPEQARMIAEFLTAQGIEKPLIPSLFCNGLLIKTKFINENGAHSLSKNTSFSLSNLRTWFLRTTSTTCAMRNKNLPRKKATPAR